MVKKKLSKKELKEKTKQYSIGEGMCAAARTAFGNNYVAPFAIAINASDSIVALFSTCTNLLGPVGQVLGSKSIHKGSRKKRIRKYLLIESLMWLPIIAVAILFLKGYAITSLPILLLLAFGMFSLINGLSFPTWFSFMGDVVSPKERGSYYSKRNFITGLTSVVLVILAAIMLDKFKATGYTIEGFAFLFILAMLSRLFSWKLFKNHYDPKSKVTKNKKTVKQIFKEVAHTNFGKFILFRTTLGFAMTISSSLLVVYLLRNLQFTYTEYMVIIFTGTVISLLFLEILGKISDKYGSYVVLCATGIIIPLTPLLWILSDNIFYLILIPATLGKGAWNGFILASKKFLYDNLPTGQRGLSVSYFNLTVGIGMALGAGVSAILIKYINTTKIAPIILIFLIGAGARMLAMFYWLPKIRESKKYKKPKNMKELNDAFKKEIIPTLNKEFHEVASIKSYLK